MANRNDILKCLGTFPKKINLSLKELTSEDMGDHERKLIEYTIEKCDEKILLEKYPEYLLYISIIVIGRLENLKLSG